MVYYWHRRDLRLHDNAPLYYALQHARKAGTRVQPVFIFDTDILGGLPRQDRRMTFLYRTITQLCEAYARNGSALWVLHGKPHQVWAQLFDQNPPTALYAGEDYEPYALQRDRAIASLALTQGAELQLAKEHVILHKDEVLTQAGRPYTVFTPYSRQWRSVLTPFHLQAYPTEKYFSILAPSAPKPLPSLEQLGFDEMAMEEPLPVVTDDLLQHYADRRDYPAQPGTSRLGVHLRFGTISIRQLAAQAMEHSHTYVNELIWRDFYSMILQHFPQVATQSFKPQYDTIAWRNDPAEYERWCSGTTGYPLVDAGMRELSQTGYMHNRVRMVVASFLTKHLLTDWRLGEQHFATLLLDYDLASNNGGWQWAAGSGCDAAPYFRIFNPESQTQKFDPQLTYIRRWVPEYGTARYPKPVVDHQMARQRALDTYKAALKEADK